MRSSIAFVSVLLLATGCRLSPAGKTGVVLGGLGIGAAGLLVASSGSTDSESSLSGISLSPEYFLGTALVVAGAAMVIGGLAAQAEEPEPLPPSAFVYGPARYTPVAGPPGAVPAARMPLPELAASEQVVRLAQQVRSAAARGDCAGAWAMWDQLDAVDMAYADAVRSGPIMGPCPR